MSATDTTVIGCEQCGTRSHQLTDTEYGPLCPQCAHRQAERDDHPFEALSASTFGFLADDE